MLQVNLTHWREKEKTVELSSRLLRGRQAAAAAAAAALQQTDRQTERKRAATLQDQESPKMEEELELVGKLIEIPKSDTTSKCKLCFHTSFNENIDLGPLYEYTK